MKAASSLHKKESYTAEEYAAVIAENRRMQQEIASIKEHTRLEINHLKEQLSWMQKQFFGQKSEKGTPEYQEYTIDLFESESEVKETVDHVETEVISYTKSKPRSKDQERQPFPDHLERRDEIIDIPEKERQCPCGCTLKKIGEVVTETLEYIPASCFVKRQIRYKYACCNEAERGVQMMRLPLRPIPGRVGASVLSYIFVSKYCDHLPLERIEKIFKRQGVRMPKSTMVGYISKTYELLKPLYQRLHEAILDCDIVNADETTVKIQDGIRKKKCHTGYYWSYIGDKKYLYFDYRRSRSKDGPVKFLEEYQGEYLQADEYSGYNEVVRANGLTRAGCWAHARRKFIKAAEAGNQRASEVVDLIAKMYKVEADAKDQNLFGEPLFHYRMKHTTPHIMQIDLLIKELAQGYPQKKGYMPEAIGYVINSWEHLKEFVQNPIFDIDNNLVERSIRPIAIGRKNWLFAGSHDGAKRSALLYSLIGTCKMHEVEPYEYLNDVLNRIQEYPKENLHHLLPDLWKKFFKKKS